MSAGALLVVIALVLAVISLLPQIDTRLLAVSVILVCIALLIGPHALHLR